MRFSEFLDRRGGSPSAEDMHDFIAERRSAWLIGSGWGVAAVVIFIGVMVLLNRVEMADIWKPVIFFPTFVLCALMMLTGVAAKVDYDEMKTAGHALDLLVAKSEAVPLARRLVDSVETFALFLRRFEDERQGETSDAYALPYGYVGRMFGIPQPSRHPDGGSLTFWMPFNWWWCRQVEVLKGARRRLPVFLLDNLTLSAKKRAELEEARVTCIAAWSDNWWDLFRLLVSQAAVTIFFIEGSSTSLAREMQHVVEARRTYLLLCSQGSLDALIAKTPDFVRGAAGTLLVDAAGWTHAVGRESALYQRIEAAVEGAMAELLAQPRSLVRPNDVRPTDKPD